jgi:hypothetical protein
MILWPSIEVLKAIDATKEGKAIEDFSYVSSIASIPSVSLIAFKRPFPEILHPAHKMYPGRFFGQKAQ